LLLEQKIKSIADKNDPCSAEAKYNYARAHMGKISTGHSRESFLIPHKIQDECSRISIVTIYPY
jgi:hypothetical protein